MDSFAAPEEENQEVIWRGREFVEIKKHEGISYSKRHLKELSMALNGTGDMIDMRLHVHTYEYTHISQIRFCRPSLKKQLVAAPMVGPQVICLQSDVQAPPYRPGSNEARAWMIS